MNQSTAWLGIINSWTTRRMLNMCIKTHTKRLQCEIKLLFLPLQLQIIKKSAAVHTH